VRNVRRIGELNARVLALEGRFAVLESELTRLRPPIFEFDTFAEFTVNATVDHAFAAIIDTEARMEVWF